MNIMDTWQSSCGLACIGSKMETQSCLCGIVFYHSMNTFPVCPMQALSCAQSVSMLDTLSDNQTTCPAQACSVSKLDSLSHNQTVYLMHILLTYKTCVLSLVILLLPWLLLHTLSWSQTICVKVRQFVSKLDNLSHIQTICPMWALSCIESILHTVWYFCCLEYFCRQCLEVRQSVWYSNNFSHM